MYCTIMKFPLLTPLTPPRTASSTFLLFRTLEWRRYTITYRRYHFATCGAHRSAQEMCVSIRPIPHAVLCDLGSGYLYTSPKDLVPSNLLHTRLYIITHQYLCIALGRWKYGVKSRGERRTASCLFAKFQSLVMS